MLFAVKEERDGLAALSDPHESVAVSELGMAVATTSSDKKCMKLDISNYRLQLNLIRNSLKGAVNK